MRYAPTATESKANRPALSERTDRTSAGLSLATKPRNFAHDPAGLRHSQTKGRRGQAAVVRVFPSCSEPNAAVWTLRDSRLVAPAYAVYRARPGRANC
jgi:hypothetical protein